VPGIGGLLLGGGDVSARLGNGGHQLRPGPVIAFAHTRHFILVPLGAPVPNGIVVIQFVKKIDGRFVARRDRARMRVKVGMIATGEKFACNLGSSIRMSEVALQVRRFFNRVVWPPLLPILRWWLMLKLRGWAYVFCLLAIWDGQ
jgi:hypothetical protein